MNPALARRKMIEIARRRRSRGAGSDLQLLMSAPRSPLAVNLTQLFTGISYVVIGGVATRLYMPERFTKDIDVLVGAQSYDAARERLQQATWQAASELRFPDSSLGLRGYLWTLNDASLDLLTSDKQWAEEACSTPVDQSGNRIISLPYLVLMKLDSGRPQDTADVSRMVALADVGTLDMVREILRRHARDSETLEDFDSLLEIGRWELGRSNNS